MRGERGGGEGGGGPVVMLLLREMVGGEAMRLVDVIGEGGVVW